jgi:RNase P subunit RPR2
MQRGCIAISETSCSKCHKAILHGARYFVRDEDDGSVTRQCQACCEKSGMTANIKEHGHEALTFFPTPKPGKEEKAARKSEEKETAKED